MRDGGPNMDIYRLRMRASSPDVGLDFFRASGRTGKSYAPSPFRAKLSRACAKEVFYSVTAIKRGMRTSWFWSNIGESGERYEHRYHNCLLWRHVETDDAMSGRAMLMKHFLCKHLQKLFISLFPGITKPTIKDALYLGLHRVFDLQWTITSIAWKYCTSLASSHRVFYPQSINCSELNDFTWNVIGCF